MGRRGKEKREKKAKGFCVGRGGEGGNHVMLVGALNEHTMPWLTSPYSPALATSTFKCLWGGGAPTQARASEDKNNWKLESSILKSLWQQQLV